MSDKILVEYQVEVDGLKAQMKEVQTTMKETEKVGKESAKGVGDEFKKTEEKTKSLKKQLQDLKAQLSITTDPKEFSRLQQEAGLLQNKINDVTKATKAFASESKVSIAKNLFSQIAGDIASLDFASAATKAKDFASVMSSITFAETLSGVKSLGIALFEMGKALLLNPLFLLAATMVAIGKAFYDSTTFLVEYGKQSKVVTDVINEQEKSQASFRDRILESNIALKETLGIYTKFQAEQARIAIKNKNEIIGIEKEKNDKIKELAEQLGLDLVKGQAKIKAPSVLGALNPFESQADDLANLKKFNDEKLIIEESYASKIRREKLIQSKLASDAETADNIERAKKAKDAIKKNREKQLEDKAKQEQLDRAIAEKRLDIQKALIDLTTQNIKDQYLRERTILEDKFREETALHKNNSEFKKQLRIKLDSDIIALDTKFYNEQKVLEENSIADSKEAVKLKGDEILSAGRKMHKAQLKAEEEAAKESLRIEREKQDAIKQLQQEAFRAAISIFNSLGELQNQKINSQLEDINAVHDAEISSLDDQLKNKTISQRQYDIQKAEAEKKQKAEASKLKREAFEQQKALAIINAIISTAEAVAKANSATPYPPVNAALMAIAAASGAAQIAVITNQKAPKFAKGGKIEGKLHSQGGTLIEAEKDEWIIKRNESIKNNDLLSAINKGKGQKFIYEMYVAPALKEQLKKHNQSKDSSFASNIANSMLLNSGNFKDGNILESLKMQRRADKENADRLISEIRKQQINLRSIV